MFRKGFHKLVKLSSKLYDIEYSKPVFSDKFNHEITWESQSSEKALELVQMLFHDLELFCVPYDTDQDPDLNENKNLEKRYTVSRESSTENIQFAIKDGEFKKYANILLDIDQNYLFIALQKKPDSIPVLKLRERLLRAVCKPQNISIQMTRSLEYREYKTEKEIYKRYQISNADYIYMETFNRLKADKLYSILLREQFQNTFFLSQNIADRMQQSYNYYILKNDDYYLENYLNSILEFSKNSGFRENQKIYEKLLLLKNPRTENNKSLLYVLAEVAFRIHKYDETKTYLDQLSKISQLAGYDYYKVNRLYFLLELENEG